MAAIFQIRMTYTANEPLVIQLGKGEHTMINTSLAKTIHASRKMIYVNLPNITFLGSLNDNNEVVTTVLGGVHATANASNLLLKDIRFQHNNTSNQKFELSGLFAQVSMTVERCCFEFCSGTGILVVPTPDDSPAPCVTVKDSSLNNNARNGILCLGPSSVTFKGQNEAKKNGWSGVWGNNADTESNITIEGNGMDHDGERYANFGHNRGNGESVSRQSEWEWESKKRVAVEFDEPGSKKWFLGTTTEIRGEVAFDDGLKEIVAIELLHFTNK